MVERCTRWKTPGSSIASSSFIVARSTCVAPPACEPGNGRGVGLRNTRERLAALYPQRHGINIVDARPGLRIEITLPYEQAVQP